MSSRAAAPSRSRLHAVGWIGASILLAFGVFVADYLTGAEISLSFFYAVAVGLASWNVSRASGILLSLACTTAWVGSYLHAGRFYSNPSILFWNTGVEIGVFLIVTLTVSAVRAGIDNQRALATQLEVAYAALDRELQAVAAVQRSLLPSKVPEVPGYRIAVHYATSTRSGGDYYDFFPLPDGRLGVFIADASGHGSPAAVVMAIVRALVHTTAEGMDSPQSLLRSLNARMFRNGLPEQFVTACYSILDPSSGRIEYSIAGHNPPLLIRGGDRRVEEFQNSCGIPLGISESACFSRGCARLGRGDTILFYTDGLTERMDPDGDLYGIERLAGLLAGQRAETAETMRDRLLVDLARHARGAPAGDDLTLVLLQAV